MGTRVSGTQDDRADIAGVGIVPAPACRLLRRRPAVVPAAGQRVDVPFQDPVPLAKKSHDFLARLPREQLAEDCGQLVLHGLPIRSAISH